MNCFRFNDVRSVLCLGAHPDDIEIGCGGTIAQRLRADVEIRWVVFSGNDVRRLEAEASAKCWLSGFQKHTLSVLRYEDGFFPEHWGAIKREFAQLADNYDPDLIFTHHLDDRHQDHRVLSELTWQAFRSHAILEYEIPKFEGDLQHPNVFVPVEEQTLQQKCQRLVAYHESQACKAWFDEELFRGHARLRGIECGVRYAEAFHARKLVLQ